MSLILAKLISLAVDVIIFLLIAQIVLHWLVIFEVVKVNNFQARHIVDSLNRFTERFYRPVRRYVPPMGGLDLSPVVVILGLEIMRSILVGILSS